jgi:predicted Rossmann fold flavoprotein
VKYYDVIILGAGAAGLMCAITAAQRGRSVLVLDSSNKVGKKILMSGGGRCNFTNLDITPENYLSNNPHFCKSALSRYTQWDFISLVQKHDIDYEERKQGQLFCVHSAKYILRMLLDECQQCGCEIKTDAKVDKIAVTNNGYQLETNIGKFLSSSLVIATGALSIPTMGASGFGYELARQFGLNVLPRRAGLVPFTFSDLYRESFEKLSGVSVEVEMSTGNTTFRENLLFTHRGLSGPVVLQISSYWKEGEDIYINLLPDMDLSNHLLEMKQSRSKSILRTQLSQILPKALVFELEKLFWQDSAEKLLADYSDKLLKEIALQLQTWRLKPSGTEGYRTAEVTLGGVDTDNLNSKTMECKQQPGLYFIGEVVDVTGHLGGYNFQWAWSSGFAAGQVV